MARLWFHKWPNQLNVSTGLHLLDINTVVAFILFVHESSCHRRCERLLRVCCCEKMTNKSKSWRGETSVQIRAKSQPVHCETFVSMRWEGHVHTWCTDDSHQNHAYCINNSDSRDTSLVTAEKNIVQSEKSAYGMNIWWTRTPSQCTMTNANAFNISFHWWIENNENVFELAYGREPGTFELSHW